MKTMLRLAKRNETLDTGELIYLENENRKIVFSGEDGYASIFAVAKHSTTALHGKRSYQVHKTLKDATAYRRAAGDRKGITTIDKQGFIYNLDFSNDNSVLLKSDDIVALSPFSFLCGYQDIAVAYQVVVDTFTHIKDTDGFTEDDKARAHQLKELAYKIITLFKYTHELSVTTCIEFNDDFFNPNPAYAEKTLTRIRVLASKISELAGNYEYVGCFSGTQSQRDNVDKAVNEAMQRIKSENISRSN